MDARSELVSRYSDAERQAILREARALLEPERHERSDKLSDLEAPSWPVRSGTILPVLPTTSADRSIAREREIAARRERALRERKQEEQRIMAERERQWVDARIAAALEAHGFNKLQVNAIGMTLAEVRDQLRDELQAAIAGLRVELAARQDRSDKVLDLPALPLRRRSSDAA
jgi:hypothetical protein